MFADGITERYPHDEQLRRFGARGYAGYPLKDEDGKPIGILAILSKQPLVDAELVEAVMKIFAVRAEAEFERRAHEEALAASAGQYRSIFERRRTDFSWCCATPSSAWSTSTRPTRR